MIARNPIDWRAGHHLALDSLPRWAPETLGRRLAWFPPGVCRWWPSPADGVHVFAGGPRCIVLGDWSGRWRFGDTWGCDLIELIAELRRCRPGQALAYVCRWAGVPDLPRVRDQHQRRAA
ncbi:hypothetical protein [Elioraea sp.]|uniref:hypothetical protein n=1 Tax=Elioraea sp. TaxID=2185103 RepID=UPI003F6E7E81